MYAYSFAPQKFATNNNVELCGRRECAKATETHEDNHSLTDRRSQQNFNFSDENF